MKKASLFLACLSVFVCAVVAQAEVSQKMRNQCRNALDNQITRDTGWSGTDVRISSASDYFISNAEVGIRGDATVSSRYGGWQNIYYNCRYNIRMGSVTNVNYNWQGGGFQPGMDKWEMARKCDQALTEKMSYDNSGSRVEIRLSNSQDYQISNNRFGLRGSAQARINNGQWRAMSFDCKFYNQNVERSSYYWEDGWGGSGGSGGSGGGGGGRPPGGVVWSGPITSRQTGKCIDVANWGDGNKANIQQWSCAGQSNQYFDIVNLGNGEYAIYSQHSRMVMDVQGDSGRDGANVQQFRWNSGRNQRWRIERASGDYYRIVNVNSGKCLDLAGSSSADGANIQQWSCSGGANQQWRLYRR
jgi:hypothetical protein